jgi:hypothetical protein
MDTDLPLMRATSSFLEGLEKMELFFPVNTMKERRETPIKTATKTPNLSLIFCSVAIYKVCLNVWT